MMYDLPSVTDYGKATEICESKTRREIANRDAAMTVIEASRQGPNLPTDVYIMFKIIHGNAEADAHRFAHYLRNFGGFYKSTQTHQWLIEQDEMTISRPSLALVWRHWRTVLDVRTERDAIPAVEVFKDRWGCNPITITSRRRIDAEIAVERTEALYDRVLRAFDGRQPPTWQQMLDGPRVKQPTKRTRVVERVRSSPTGYKKTGKYETRPDGVRVPTVRKP